MLRLRRKATAPDPRSRAVSPASGSGRRLSPARLLTRAGSLLAQNPADLVELGRVLEAARQLGEFGAICDTLPIHTRKAYDLISIAGAVDDGRLRPEVVDEIGWTKARLIATRTSTKQETLRALALAPSVTVPALAAYLRDEQTAEPLVTKSFHLTQTEAAQLETALRRAGAHVRGGRIENRSEALMVIVRAFRSKAGTS